MKQTFLYIILLYHVTLFGQTEQLKNYDSLIVQTFTDYTYEVDFNSGKRLDTIIITGQTVISDEDAKELNRRIMLKESYGQNQAITPVYDMKIIYYKNGKVKEEVKISLWTNNLFATYPLKIQRQGECMCGGNGGYCCTKGGISISFKKYLLDLLEKYNLPADREEILNFGQ